MARRNEELVEDHRQITSLARRIKDAERRDVLIRLLPEFCARLEQHFAGEEASGGFFDMIRSDAPERQRSIDELAKQHRDMLSVARSLVELAQTEGLATDAEIIEQAHQIADVLSEHEAAENRLILEVFNTDVGASD